MHYHLKKRKFIISYRRKSCVPWTSCWIKRFPEEPVTKRSYPLSKSLVILITLATTPLGLEWKVLRGPSPSTLHWFPAFTQGTIMTDFLASCTPHTTRKPCITDTSSHTLHTIRSPSHQSTSHHSHPFIWQNSLYVHNL